MTVANDNDFGDIDDFDPDVILTGAQVVAAALGRRITTPPGGLHYDPAYVCVDLEAWLNRALTDADLDALRAQVERCVRAETRADPDITTVDVDFYAAGGVLQVVVQGVTVDGASFELTATADPDEGIKLALSAA